MNKKEAERDQITAFDKLSAPHKKFLTSYVESLNATKAYLKTYPAVTKETAGTNGTRLLYTKKMQEALKEYYDNIWDNREDLIGSLFQKLLSVSNFDIADYVDDNGDIKLEKLKTENSFPIVEVKRVMKETKNGMDITESIKTVDKLKAIEQLTKILGMIKEKIEHTGSIVVIPAERPKKPEGEEK